MDGGVDPDRGAELGAVLGPDGRHGPHAFVTDMDAPVLAHEDRDHLERSLRVRRGDPLTVSDGAGSWRACTMGSPLEVAGPVMTVQRQLPRITVAFALMKGARPELVVQKLTELGVDDVIPFVAARSVVRWDGEKASRQVARLARVSREAAMQSRRCWLATVHDLATFAEVAALPGAALAEREGPPPGRARSTILIGPEGGWDDSERLEVTDRVGFGPQVLRAETAALAAAAILVGLRAGVVCGIGDAAGRGGS